MHVLAAGGDRRWEFIRRTVFLYFEDIDLCFRLKNEGRKVIYYPDAAMVHYHVRESARGFMNRAKWELFISLLKFYFKHGRLAPG